MSQTTGEELLNRINATLDVLQDAQEEAVTAVRDVASHKIDPEAHGDLLRSAVEAAVDEALGGASAEELAALQEALATLAGRFDAGGKLLPANLPPATKAALGAVRIGGGLSVTAQGLLAASCLILSRRNGLPVYVRKGGNDSNDGLTEATAVASIARAKAILHTLDFGNTSAIIDVGEGTFDITNVLFTRVPLCQSFAILSGAGKGKTILTAGASDRNSQGRIEPSANWQFKNLTLRATSAGSNALNVNGGNLALLNVAVETGATATVPLMVASNRGIIALSGTCSFSGKASHFIGADNVSLAYINGSTTFSGTVTTATVYAARNSLFLIAEDGSVSGKVTGPRYTVSQNGVIFTRGGGPNFFPGTTAGTSATGGLYV